MTNPFKKYLATRLADFIQSNATDDATALITDDIAFGYGDAPEIPLERIVNRYKTNIKFDFTCNQLMAYSVASGFNVTVDGSSPRAQACIDLIDSFNKTWKLQEKNLVAAYETYASGNTFFNTPGVGGKIDGLYYMPLSSVLRITRDDSEIIGYHTQLGSRIKFVESDQVAHFKMGTKDGAAFGEGIGQPMERKGLGYKSSNGKWIYKPSDFDIDEMIDDVEPKMVYSGMPKFVVTPKDKDTRPSPTAIQTIRNAFNKLDPLKHLVTNEMIEVQTTELATQSKHDTFLEHIHNNFIVGMKSPFIKLISDFSFSFASSQTALDTALPIIKIFKTNYGEFIEDEIYRPLIIQSGKNPDKLVPHHNWISIDQLTIDTIQKAAAITSSPEFVDLFDPVDILKMLNEIGTKYDINEPGIINMLKKQKRENDIQKAIAEVYDSKEKANDIIQKAAYKTNL